MIQLDDLRLAAALAQADTLAAAARAMHLTPPALSMRLKKLEATLGVALAVRSTQGLRLTPEGERFAAEAERLLAQLDALPATLQGDTARLSGRLRLIAPFGYGRAWLAPLLAPFAQQHPGLDLSLDLRETPWAERAEADAVIHIGTVRDSSWIGRLLHDNERWVCASPDYLRRHGRPAHPRELPAHACIGIRENDEDPALWRFQAADGTRESVRVTPRYLSNDGGIARQWAEEGLGIVLRSQWDADAAVRSGRLVRLFEDWDAGSAPVMLLVPTREGRAPRVQALVDHLLAGLGVS